MQEEQWAKQRIEARLKLVEAEMRLKQVERAFTSENRESFQMQKALDELKNWQAYLQNVREKSIKGDTDPMVVRARQNTQESEEKVRKASIEVEKRFADVNAAILPIREIMVAEEHLSLLDRLTALKRRAAQAQVEDLQDRLGQLRAPPAALIRSSAKVKELDRKLDDVLRELTELRRELRK